MNIKRLVLLCHHHNLEKWISLGLILLVFSVYWGITGNGFIDYDDHEYVTRNDQVQAGITTAGFLRAFVSVTAANWHPLTVLSHMLDCQFYGLNPFGHHLTSLLLHTGNVLVLFLLLREATGRLWESAAVAALFAVHPLHVESVAWISERKDVLSGFFFMLSVLMYIRYAGSGQKGKYMLSIVFFLCGLMAKPMLVTLPILLFLMDYWPLGRLAISPAGEPRPGKGKRPVPSSRARLLVEKVPYAAIAVLFGIVTLIVQSRAGATSTFAALPMGVRLANALIAYQSYVEMLFYPLKLAVFYPHPLFMPPSYRIVSAALFLAGITLLVFLHARRKPFAAFGWLWFLLSLLPVAGIIQVGLQAMADRYVYLPVIGIYVALVFGFPYREGGPVCRRTAFFLLWGFAIAFLSVNTLYEVGRWKDTKTLFTRAAAVTGKNWLAGGILSGVYLNEGNNIAAEYEARKALAFSPLYADGHVFLAEALRKKGALDEATRHLREALRINPRQAQAYMELGRIRAASGEIDQAMLDYAEAEKFMPRNSWSYNILGIAYAMAGGPERAVIQFQKAMDLAPKRPDTYNNMGMALLNQNRPAEALPYLMRALELQPAFAEAYNNTGVALMKIRKFEKAAYYFSVALLFRPDYEKARANLHRLARLMSREH